MHFALNSASPKGPPPTPALNWKTAVDYGLDGDFGADPVMAAGAQITLETGSMVIGGTLQDVDLLSAC